LTLLVKTQLKDYESGEFSDIKERTYPETRELIESYPWSEQREHISISLTNPSITIEGGSGDFLKLASYYNGKFVLYYLDGNNHLFTHSMSTLEEAYPIIQSFFEDHLDLGNLKREHTLFTNNRIHFQTRTFNYTMHAVPTILWVCLLSLIWLVLPVGGGIGALLFATPASIAAVVLIGTFILGNICCGAAFVASFISHYRASIGMFLSISRGNPIFQFGPIETPVTYDKKDIKEIVQYGASRGLDGLKRTEIIFKDGTSINISGMIAEIGTMAQKFPEQRIKIKSTAFPFIPRAASTPS
jgi:hypothetical protein